MCAGSTSLVNSMRLPKRPTMSHIRFGRPNVRADGRETGLPGPGTIWEAGIPGVGGTNDGDEGDLDHRPALHPLSSRAEARRVQTRAGERPPACIAAMSTCWISCFLSPTFIMRTRVSFMTYGRLIGCPNQHFHTRESSCVTSCPCA